MNSKNLRGVLGAAAIWAALAVPFAIIHAGISALFGKPTPPLSDFAPLLTGVMVRGAIAGAAFAGLLTTLARGRTFKSLRLADTASWGALGSLVSPAVAVALSALPHATRIPAPVFLSAVAQTAMVGAICGMGTLAIARRAPELPALRGDDPGQRHLPA